MDITWPEDTKSTIDKIRGAIGRPVLFIMEERTVCSSCILDPVTDTSTNSYCLTCSGEGYTYTYSGVSISGHITFGTTDINHFSSGGNYFEGDCRVQVEYTNLNLDCADRAKYLIVDTKKFTVKKKILRGVKALNRILLDLVEKT